MTPTNEAGHGLPELPEPNITDVIERELHRAYMEHEDYTVTTTLLRSFAEAAFSVFEAQQKGESALALSRGVPEGYALVPIDLRTSCDVWEAGIKARNSGGSVADIWAAMLAAAPAAAGAQGEELGTCSRHCSDTGQCTNTCGPITQPAAADGGVRAFMAKWEWLILSRCREEFESDLAALSSHRQAGDAQDG